MNNNVNPNENLNQVNNDLTQVPTTNNVPLESTNNQAVQSNNVVETVPVNNNVNVLQNVSNMTTVSNTEQLEENDDSNKNDEKFSLFKKEENKTTPVIMSKQMSDKIEAERRKQREKSEQYEAKPVSKFKYAMMIIFFIFMFALIYFLPDITNYINIQKDLKKQENAPAITTGLLTCKMDRTTDNFNLSYTAQFGFTDSKLNKLSYVTSTTGDAVIDSDELDNILNKCKLLQNQVASLSGVRVNCSQSEGTVVETQEFTYSAIDKEKINSAYIEAGGVYPEFDNEQDIDVIEKNMSASGYKCERTTN